MNVYHNRVRDTQRNTLFYQIHYYQLQFVGSSTNTLSTHVREVISGLFRHTTHPKGSLPWGKQTIPQ